MGAFEKVERSVLTRAVVRHDLQPQVSDHPWSLCRWMDREGAYRGLSEYYLPLGAETVECHYWVDPTLLTGVE